MHEEPESGSIHIVFSLTEKLSQQRPKSIQEQVEEAVEPQRAPRLIALYDTIQKISDEHPVIVATAFWHHVLTDREREVLLQKKEEISRTHAAVTVMKSHPEAEYVLADALSSAETDALSKAGDHRIAMVNLLTNFEGIEDANNTALHTLRTLIDTAVLVMLFDGKSVGIEKGNQDVSHNSQRTDVLDLSLKQIDSTIDWQEEVDDGFGDPQRSL
jgi:hypothetical protein